MLIISAKGKGVRLQSLFCYKWWWRGILSFGDSPDPSPYQRIYLLTCFLINGHFWFITQNQRPLRKSITLSYYYCLFKSTFWAHFVWFEVSYLIRYPKSPSLLRTNIINKTLNFLIFHNKYLNIYYEESRYIYLNLNTFKWTSTRAPRWF